MRTGVRQRALWCVRDDVDDAHPVGAVGADAGVAGQAIRPRAAPLQTRRGRRTMRPADSRIAATDSTPIATPVTGSHRSRTLWAEGRSAALVRPFVSWLLPAPTTTSALEPQALFPTVLRHPAVRGVGGPRLFVSLLPP